MQIVERSLETPKINGWNEWSRFVLGGLQRVEERLESLERKIEERVKTAEQEVLQLRVELAKLQIKSSLWGAVAGALTIAIMMGLSYLKG